MEHGKRKRAAFAALAALILSLLPGCAGHKAQEETLLRVGVVLYTQDDPYINALADCLKKSFKDLESDRLRITMTVRTGKNDQSIQDRVVEEMIDAGCDVLCVDLVDRTAPANIIEMAKRADVPLLFFNREPVWEDLMKWEKIYYIGGDAKQSGNMQGEIAADVIAQDEGADRNRDGRIQYVLLEGEAGHQDAIIRTDCSVKTLIARNIALEKLSYQFADWSRAQAENKMTQLIGQYGDGIELVLANNDEMALGAVAAYEKLGYSRERRPVIFGIDGLTDALSAVSDGTIQGTVYQDKEGQALTMARLSVDLCLGNSLKAYSFQEGKYIFLPYQKVTLSNVAGYLKE